jgi:hypothetical protein
MNTVNHHPTTPTLTKAQFDAWPNCQVKGCTAKVTHNSDKCFPHTYGWEAVRKNVIDRLAFADKKYDKHKTKELREEIKWCKGKLEEIKENK